jgi:hypothetical protein
MQESVPRRRVLESEGNIEDRLESEARNSIHVPESCILMKQNKEYNGTYYFTGENIEIDSDREIQVTSVKKSGKHRSSRKFTFGNIDR